MLERGSVVRGSTGKGCEAPGNIVMYCYLFIYLSVQLFGSAEGRRQVAASPLRHRKSFSCFLFLFELSLIFKCLFQAFPRHGRWRICLISRSHHGAHLYCTEAMSSVPSSLFLSLLLSSYTSAITHRSSSRPPSHFKPALRCGSQCVLVFEMIILKSKLVAFQLWWMRWRTTHKHTRYGAYICQSLFSQARKMSRNSVAVDLISLLTSSPVRPALTTAVSPALFFTAEIILHRFKRAI